MEATKKGHWPKGKRRNPPIHPGLIPALRNFYRGCKSLIIIAEECNVDPHTVKRWMTGEWRPNPKQAKRIAKMLGM
jgi:hypothetical protein